MCGIVGHIGPSNSIKSVLEGLKRLEYRGYDSAGISFVDEKDHLNVIKKSGKLENLRGLLEGKNYVARSCIGHTRWATHGEVNDTNSHPHNNEDIALVHNGIIENADELKKQLIAHNEVFKSETDSEVFLVLITHIIKTEKLSLLEAVAKAFTQISGNSAFVILNRATAEIIAVKRGAPLVCGINDISSEVLVSSDPYALVGLVSKLYFPENDVICSLSGAHKNLLNFYELDLRPSKRYMSKKQDMALEITDKGEFEHFMLKEIYEQPELIRALGQYYFHGEGSDSLLRSSRLKPTRIIISACGTAYYAGLCIRDFFESINRIPVQTELASEFRYRDPIMSHEDVGIFVSQSGETADTLAAQELCKTRGITTQSIVNVDGSTLFRSCQHNLLIRAGIEIGVASTKAFTQQVLTGRLLSFAMTAGEPVEFQKNELLKKFNLLAERIDHLIADPSHIRDIASNLYDMKGFFFTGRGKYYPVALEGALKLKEIAYVHAEGYAAGELKHGPIALIDQSIVNIAIIGPELFEKTFSNIQEIRARKGIIVTIGPNTLKNELGRVSDYSILLDFEGLEELTPLLVNVANQLFAYYMAKNKGTDIDKPRNLAKSVTVE